MSIKCCYKCKDRYVGCHDRCEMYQNEKREHEAEKDRIHKIKEIEIMAGESIHRSMKSIYKK